MTLEQLKLCIRFNLNCEYELKEITPQPGVVLGYLIQICEDLDTDYQGCSVSIIHSEEFVKLKLLRYQQVKGILK